MAETRPIIEAEGGTCATHRCDMTVAAEVQEMVQACLDRFKRIDILVNNVGGSAPGDPVSMTEEVWDRQIDFNLKTAFLGCKYVLPVMVGAGQGRDRQHRLGRRHAQRFPRRALARRLQRIQGRRDPAFPVGGGHLREAGHPGEHRGPGADAHAAGRVPAGAAPSAATTLQKLIEQRNAAVPMGHMGDAWDVAHAVLFLASDEARFITATEIVVDGGSSAALPYRGSAHGAMSEFFLKRICRNHVKDGQPFRV